MPGIHAYIEHLPGGVDWVVLLNGGEHEQGKPSPLNYCTQRLREAIGRVKRWPQRDLFPRLSSAHSAEDAPVATGENG